VFSPIFSSCDSTASWYEIHPPKALADAGKSHLIPFSGKVPSSLYLNQTIETYPHAQAVVYWVAGEIGVSESVWQHRQYMKREYLAAKMYMDNRY